MTGWAGDYCTLDELKAHLRITDPLDTADDAALGVAITAASRAIDHEANRQYGLAGSIVPRYYTYGRGAVSPFVGGMLGFYGRPCQGGERIDGRPALSIDDLMTTTGLLVGLDLNGDGTFSTALTYGTDFDVWPYNAQADGKPWTHLVLRPTAAAWFPAYARGIRVSANYGWSTVPVLVKQATLMQAARFFARRDAKFGVAGSPELGSEVRLLARLDPDVALLLSSVKRQWAAAS